MSGLPPKKIKKSFDTVRRTYVGKKTRQQRCRLHCLATLREMMVVRPGCFPGWSTEFRCCPLPVTVPPVTPTNRLFRDRPVFHLLGLPTSSRRTFSRDDQLSCWCSHLYSFCIYHYLDYVGNQTTRSATFLYSHYVILYYIILCYIILYYIIIYYILLYFNILYYIILERQCER